MKRDKAYLKKVVNRDMDEDLYYDRPPKKQKVLKIKNNKQSKNKKDWDRYDESDW